MRTREQSTTYHMLLATGLALATVIGLLWWIGRHAPAAQALTAAPFQAPSIYEDGIGAAWASFDPTRTLVLKGQVTPWMIEGYGVTITFRLTSLTGDAIFTFTPQVDVELGPPEIPSYAFELVGTYVTGGRDAGFQVPISMTLLYEHAEIKDAQEQTLTFFHYDEFGHVWIAQHSRVDSVENIVTGSTNETGLFTLAGYRHQVSLPVVIRSDVK